VLATVRLSQLGEPSWAPVDIGYPKRDVPMWLWLSVAGSLGHGHFSEARNQARATHDVGAETYDCEILLAVHRDLIGVNKLTL
jgi:hypothetical protein